MTNDPTGEREAQIIALTHKCAALCNDDAPEMCSLFAEAFAAFLAYSVRELCADAAVVQHSLSATKEFADIYLNASKGTLQ